MFIGYLKVNIFIPHSQSLKERRKVVGSIKQRVANNFNVSIAERPSDTWQKCELSFACINYTKSNMTDIIDRIEDFIRLNNDIHIIEIEKGVL